RKPQSRANTAPYGLRGPRATARLDTWEAVVPMAHTTNRRFGTFGLTTLTLGAAAAATAFLSPAVASAGPMEMAEPLLTSDCSFAQVDAALHDQAPELAAMLDANPDAKAQLQAKFDQPVEQRR